MSKVVKYHILNDIVAVFRGAQAVAEASVKLQQKECRIIWNNSSIKSTVENCPKEFADSLKNLDKNFDVSKFVNETVSRSSMVVQGVREYATYSRSETVEEPIEGLTPDDLKTTELNYKDQQLIEKLEKEYELKLERDKKKSDVKVEIRDTDIPFVKKVEAVPLKNQVHVVEKPKVKEQTTDRPIAKKFEAKRPTLNPNAKQRTVPSSRIGRMISFGSLAAGLGIGTAAEVTRRALGMSDSKKSSNDTTLDSLFLTEANAERIVNTLCKVRGAALKIGQILSIQDNTVISPGLQKAFERVRQSADFMPSWQVYKVLSTELGTNWREKLESFDEKPFAAASIGQVHLVKLKDGREAAMKIQYPGVAAGIESDINNLVGILKVWNVFPEGLFIDNLVEVAKRELAWEVDYVREAQCTKKFKQLLKPYPQFFVPEVIDDLCTSQVFTSELIEGIPVDQCVELDSHTRDHIAKLVMELCLRELFEFRFMQTDPNWSNFFYNPNTRQLILLDFGASREYEKEFMDMYIEVTKGAADRDRDKVLQVSRKMGFLTGYESKIMEDAHIDAVMILGEVFASDEPFDFGSQDTTRRIQTLLPTIVYNRLCPPPEEIYSLHRKLSGVFLLCAKLKVKISCRQMFLQVYQQYHKQ